MAVGLPALLLGLLAGCDGDAPTPETGEPVPDSGATPVDADGDGSTADVDCDDQDGEIHPGAADACDGVDQDCDGDLAGEGSCADGLDLDGFDTLYWEAQADNGSFGAGYAGFLDGEPVRLGGVYAFANSSVDTHNGAAFILAGLPDDTHDWRQDAVAIWLAENNVNYLLAMDPGGDVDGDGFDDVWVVLRDLYTHQRNELFLVPGPSSGWSWSGVYAREVASSWWSGTAANDDVGRSPVGGHDLDQDGFADLVVSSWGAEGESGYVAVVHGSADPAPGEHSILDETIAFTGDDNVRRSHVILDLDGDGFDDVLNDSFQSLDFLSGAELMPCSPCEVSDIGSSVLVTDDAVQIYTYDGAVDAGDLDGDGRNEAVAWVQDTNDDTREGTCLLWLDGATIGARTTVEVDDATRACQPNADANGSSTEDLDNDGVRDGWTYYTEERSRDSVYLVPSTRLALAARVEAAEVGFRFGGLSGTMPDIDGDGLPEFWGQKDGESNRFDLVLGFPIPWDDASKW